MLAGAMALTACAGGNGADAPSDDSAAGAEEGPIQVVILGGLGAEGVLQDLSTTSVTAAKASVAKVNADGGILDRQVELTVIDDTSDPTIAVTRLREHLATADEKPTLVMNSGPSTIAEATIPILTQENILSLNMGPTAATSDPSVSPYNFDFSPTVNDYLGGFITEMESRGYGSVGILHGSSAYGELFGQTGAEMFADAGFDVTESVGYDNAALDMTAQIERLKSGDPDVVVLDSYGAPLGYVLDSFQKVGWDVPIMGNNSVSSTSLIATPPPGGLLGTDQVENLTMQVFNSTAYDASDDNVNEAVQLMVQEGEIKSSLIQAYNYDSMALLKAAAESAGSLETEALVAALEDKAVLDSAETAMISRFAFTADSHAPNVDPSELKFISPGEMIDGQYHSE